MALLAETVRGPLVESRHDGHIAVVAADGSLVAGVGDADRVTYLRSSGKPAQALIVVETGAADRFGLTDGEVAVICGSHTGSDAHRAAAASVLAKAGLSEAHLQCGVHAPGDRAAAEALARAGAEPSPLHNNCSGKHAGMLAACVHLGLPTETYPQAQHPLQQRILARIAALSGMPAGDIVLAEDGCGVPTFGIPLSAAALLFAHLACDDAPGPRRIRAAMAAHPEMVRGRGDFNTELLRVLGDRIVAKGGAEALFCIGVRELAIGIAIRIEDGNGRAMPEVAVSVLDRLGCLTPEDQAALPFGTRAPLTNCHGHVVGETRAARFRMRRHRPGGRSMA